MGRLAGFTAAEVVRKLRRARFEFDRHAKGSHELWWHPESRRRVTLPNHAGDLPEGTMRAIVAQMGMSVDEFIDL
jgi:predicted RNA binding protein YcfA (HicA-like mRNA interferase family)